MKLVVPGESQGKEAIHVNGSFILVRDGLSSMDENGIRSHVDRQRSTFLHEEVEKVVWQPRFSDWYSKNCIIRLRPDMTDDELASLGLKCPDLPRAIFGMEQYEVYDYLNASARYPGEIFPLVSFFSTCGNPDADIKHEQVTDRAGNRYHKIKTPYGVLTESWRAGSSYPDERILKTREDFKAVLYYLDNSCQELQFNEYAYDIYQEINEGRVAAVASPWRSPFNKCIVELAGTWNTMVLMKRYTEEFDAFCAELERINNERILPALLDSPIEYVSFGDNVDCRNNPPPVYEKYILPYFERSAEACKKAGKFTFAHFDGGLEDLLPYLGDDLYPFDGIEAPTILPQGDVTLEQLRHALGDETIVLDGIPSTIFLPHFSDEKFVSLVNDVLEAFAPNLILGVSDEYSPNGLFRRLEMVDGLIDKFHRA